MTAYYNEHDPFAAQWLRNLIAAGEIAPGVVDDRDIQQVTEDDLEGFTQVHLFAGIGGWSLALRLAGWPDDRPVWTGSCPCQPFSAAGKGKAQADKRHLWPDMSRLIRKRRPAIVFGEQVEKAIGFGWLDGVFADLEREDYACASAVLPAACIDAPHMRHRILWLAKSDNEDNWRERRNMAGETQPPHRSPRGEGKNGNSVTPSRETRRLANPECARVRDERRIADEGSPCRMQAANGERERLWLDAWTGGETGGLGNTNDPGPQGRTTLLERSRERSAWATGLAVRCDAGKVRRIEPRAFPLAHGLPRKLGPGSTKEQRVELLAAKSNRVGRIAGYGNAVVVPLAAAFILASEATP